MRVLAILSLCTACAANSAPPAESTGKSLAPAEPAQPAPASDAARARHVLNRFAFGPKPGEVERMKGKNLDAWFSVQLEPASLSDPAGSAALARYSAALAPPEELPELFTRPGRDPEQDGLVKSVAKRRVIGEVALAQLARQVESERQVLEVMVDFWSNHFNVFAPKGPVALLAGDYVERAIRPHALGRFEELLLASARHPAMLFYLDNVRSRASKRSGRNQLNENYARELLELHTLGVDGGYQQRDVIEVARVLTGWSMEQPRSGRLGFRFRPALHDRGEKRVLGQRFPAGGGFDEGQRLLHMLATHPSTARHLARKLCQRFVSDQPSGECVAKVAASYREHDGDIKQLLRTIFALPEFWSSADSKLKSPQEFLVSALRALGARPDGTAQLGKVALSLGQLPLSEPVPTGYPEQASAWQSSHGLMSRMNVAVDLAYHRLPGVEFDALPPAAARASDREIVRAIVTDMFGASASDELVGLLEQEIREVAKPDKRRVALALALASPEFQRQ